MKINSEFATNTGALILNLASRGLFVKVGVENQIIGGQILFIMVSNGKATLKEAITEQEVSQIQDVGVIADAIAEKLRKMRP